MWRRLSVSGFICRVPLHHLYKNEPFRHPFLHTTSTETRARSLLCERLVEVHDREAQTRVGGVFDRRDLLVALGLADGEELFGFFRGAGVLGAEPGESLAEDGLFLAGGAAGG